jgi:hypothetical protein
MKTDRTRRAGVDDAQAKRSARFRRVFGSVDGKKVLEDLVERSGMNGPLFATDQRVQDANVARNDFMVWILEQIKGGKE